MQEMIFDLVGQRLVPKKSGNAVGSGSSGFCKIKINGFPEGFGGVAYFRQSWTGETIGVDVTNGEVLVDDAFTTLPAVVNEYIDYKLYFSIVAKNAKGEKLATNEAVIYVDPNGANSGAVVLPVGCAVFEPVTAATPTMYNIGTKHESATFFVGFNQGGIATYCMNFVLQNGGSKLCNAPSNAFYTVRYADGVAYVENQQPDAIGLVVGN